MPAWLPKSLSIGIKVVSVRSSNMARGLPTVPAMVVLIDAETGMPQALLDGTYLTRLRTGAAVGAATELLSRPDSTTLAMIGAGALAPFCIEAVCAVRRIDDVRIVSLTSASARRVESWCKQHITHVHARVVTDAGEALRDSDIVVCATTSSTPVIDGNALKPGAHVNGVGSFRKDMQEIDEETMRRARIVVDSIDACLEEAGDLIIAMQRGILSRDQIHAELGEIVAGTRPGRQTDDEITVFKSVGNAVQDIAVAHAAFSRFQMS
jgi:ornithine cyclodeaminase